MMTAIDFGCYEIRSAYRRPATPKKVVLASERSEYAVLPNLPAFSEAVTSRGIAHAYCEKSIVVFGNQAADVRWISRKPCAPLFTDGRVPTHDAPARQILNILTQSLLPKEAGGSGECYFVAPGGRDRLQSAEFLGRLIRMHGYQPKLCSVSEATNLACANDTSFTCITICMGTEQCEISISRYGMVIASEFIDVGANWIDQELAKQLKVYVWDEAGECYLDLEAIREWKHDPQIHLRKSVGERERTLARLYGVVLDRIARSVRTLMNSHTVASVMKDARFTVICSGGPTLIGGFAGALTERFVEQDTASRILAIRVVEDPAHAVVRGLLIHGELESQKSRPVEYAA